MSGDLERAPLSTPEWWMALDRRIAQAMRRIARPVRGTLTEMAAAGTVVLARFLARAGEEALDEVEVASPWGFRSLAPAGVEVIAVPLGGSSAAYIVIGAVDRTMGPTDLAAGDAALYSALASVVCRVSGKVEINGGGHAVARVGDSCAPSAEMAAWISAVSAATHVTPPTSTAYEISSGSATVEAG